ncbi:SH3 domain-containing protein [Parablastomonas sp. CN1-191]|uniref:SH3 domain-containing protein n=1 Tax=Parablastomonas sp. CN1-191 TaxID=3400908 RepID=UPI003BF7DE6E
MTTAAAVPTHQLALSGPSECLDAPHWPVRGDLAHVRLAGICFVPHYAVPMPHLLSSPADLKVKPQDDADARETLAAGTTFNVLDMAGGWAWGQVGEDGCVGYLPLDVLEARRS